MLPTELLPLTRGINTIWQKDDSNDNAPTRFMQTTQPVLVAMATSDFARKSNEMVNFPICLDSVFPETDVPSSGSIADTN